MAVRFDDGADQLTRTTNLPGITGFTLMGWFKISVDRNDYSSFFTFGVSDGATFYTAQTDGSGVTLNAWNGASNVSGSTLTVGAWNHIAMTVAGTGAGQFLTYLNGTLNITASGNASVTAQTLYVGNNIYDEFLNGCAAAVKVYSAVLTAAEIQQEMRQYIPFRTANINGRYPCLSIADDEIDYSGNGFNWTVGGTLATEDGPPIPWSFEQSQVIYIVSGGTVFTHTLAGTLTPVGSLVRQINKITNGALNPSGVLVKRVNKALSGALGLSGVLVKRVEKVVSGSIGVSGTLAVALRRAISLAGTLTVSGALIKRVDKALSGSVTPVGTVHKQINKVLSGSVTPAGALSKQVNKVLSGALSLVGAISSVLISGGGTLYSVTVDGVLSLSGSLVKQVNKVLSGSVTPVGTVSKQVNKVLVGVITPVSVLVKQGNKVLSGVLTPIGTIANAARFSVILSGALALSSSLVKQVSKVLSGSLPVSSTLVKRVNKVLLGVITPIGTLIKEVRKNIGGSLGLSGVLTVSYIRQITLSGSLTMVGTLVSTFINGTGVVLRSILPWARRRDRGRGK